MNRWVLWGWVVIILSGVGILFILLGAAEATEFTASHLGGILNGLALMLLGVAIIRGQRGRLTTVIAVIGLLLALASLGIMFFW